jgi:hypothetical protein
VSLRARLWRLEGQVDWLHKWGEYRLAKAELDYRDMKRKVRDALARDPDAAAKWAAAGYPGEFLPPRAPPRPPPMAPAAPPPSASPPPPPLPPAPPRQE